MSRPQVEVPTRPQVAGKAARVAARPAPTRHRVLGAWVLWVTGGEVLGFTLPAIVGTAAASHSEASVALALVLAGTMEGAVLGLAQAHVAVRVLPGLHRGRWVGLTALGAALAWVAGLVPTVTYPVWSDWPAAAIAVPALALGLVLVYAIGGAQWLELRRHVERAGSWVAVTALAWALGLVAFLAVTSPLWQPGQPPVLVFGVGVLGAAVMALTMATVTGLAVRRWRPRPEPVPPAVTPPGAR